MLKPILVACAALTLTCPALAADYHLTIKDDAFEPTTLTIPAKEKAKLIVKNETSRPAEFESESLNREKVIGAGSEGTIMLPAMEPGTHTFNNDFKPKVVGQLIVK